MHYKFCFVVQRVYGTFLNWVGTTTVEIMLEDPNLYIYAQARAKRHAYKNALFAKAYGMSATKFKAAVTNSTSLSIEELYDQWIHLKPEPTNPLSDPNLYANTSYNKPKGIKFLKKIPDIEAYQAAAKELRVTAKPIGTIPMDVKVYWMAK